MQRIQLLLASWIPGVARNAPGDGLAKPRSGEQQQPSDADDDAGDRHDEHFRNGLKDPDVHGARDEQGASKVSRRNGQLAHPPSPWQALPNPQMLPAGRSGPALNASAALPVARQWRR